VQNDMSEIMIFYQSPEIMFPESDVHDECYQVAVLYGGVSSEKLTADILWKYIKKHLKKEVELSVFAAQMSNYLFEEYKLYRVTVTVSQKSPVGYFEVESKTGFPINYTGWSFNENITYIPPQTSPDNDPEDGWTWLPYTA